MKGLDVVRTYVNFKRKKSKNTTTFTNYCKTHQLSNSRPLLVKCGASLLQQEPKCKELRIEGSVDTAL